MTKRNTLATELESRGWILAHHFIDRRAYGRRHKLLIAVLPNSLYPGHPANAGEIADILQERFPTALITEFDSARLTVLIETPANEPLMGIGTHYTLKQRREYRKAHPEEFRQ